LSTPDKAATILAYSLLFDHRQTERIHTWHNTEEKDNMATLVKMILIFGCIIFLISKSRAAAPTGSADISSLSSHQSHTQYTLCKQYSVPQT